MAQVTSWLQLANLPVGTHVFDPENGVTAVVGRDQYGTVVQSVGTGPQVDYYPADYLGDGFGRPLHIVPAP